MLGTFFLAMKRKNKERKHKSREKKINMGTWVSLTEPELLLHVSAPK